MKKTIAILLALCMLFAFAACGSDDGSEQETTQAVVTLTGKWYRVVKDEADENPTYEFNEDGTGSWTRMREGGRTESKTFTYVDEAGKITFTYEDGLTSDIKYTFDGDKLVIGANTFVKK